MGFMSNISNKIKPTDYKNEEQSVLKKRIWTKVVFIKTGRNNERNVNLI